MTQHENDALLNTLASLNDDVPPMPEDFHQGWTRLVEDNAMQTRTNHSRIRRIITQVVAAAAALILVVGGAAIGSDLTPPTKSRTAAASTGTTAKRSAANYDGYSYTAGNGQATTMMATASSYDMDDMVMEEAAEDVSYDTSDNGAVQNPSKIIRTASLTITTQSYDDAMASLRALCEQTGGWVSSSSESTRSNLRTAYLTFRVPAEHLDLFLDGSGSAGRITGRSEYTTDVSESYYDTKARLETQKALMARLTALVTDAADLSDLLALETKIADVQYNIDRLQGSLNSTDRQVNYSTVDVTLKEELPSDAFEDDEMTLGRRIGYAFQVGLESFTGFFANLAVFVVAALPFIIILAVGVGVILVIRKYRRKPRS